MAKKFKFWLMRMHQIKILYDFFAPNPKKTIRLVKKNNLYSKTKAYLNHDRQKFI